MNIGKSVTAAMDANGMTVKEFAEKYEVGEQRVYQLRRSRTASQDTMEKLAEFFRMPEDEFIALGN